MRAFERLTIFIVGLTLTAYLASQTYTPQQAEIADIAQLYPPKAAIETYFGPPLEVSRTLLVVGLGGQKPIELTLQALSTPYKVALSETASCITTNQAGNTLVGPCYTQTKVVEGDTENITLTIIAPLFQQQSVPAGSYSATPSQPVLLAQQCGGKNTIYINFTQVLQASPNSCVTIQLVQIEYLEVGGAHG